LKKSAEPTKSDLLRSWISKKLDSHFDYSTNSGRNTDLHEFAKVHKIKDLKNLTQLQNKLLKEQLKRRGLSPASIGFSKRIPQIRSGGGLSPTITPKPQESIAGTTDQQTETQTSQTGQGEQVPQIQPIVQTYSSEGVKATFHGLYLGIKQLAPEAEDLSPAELQSLGELWTPIFNKYLSEKAEILVCIIATAGIFIPKLAKGRKKKKEKTPIETKPEESTKKGEVETKPTEEKTPTVKDVKQEAKTQDEIDAIESKKIKESNEDQWDK